MDVFARLPADRGASLDYYRIRTEYFRKECSKYRHLWNKEKSSSDNLHRKLGTSNPHSNNPVEKPKGIFGLTKYSSNFACKGRDNLSDDVCLANSEPSLMNPASLEANNSAINSNCNDSGSHEQNTHTPEARATSRAQMSPSTIPNVNQSDDDAKARSRLMAQKSYAMARKMELSDRDMRKRNPLVKFAPKNPLVPSIHSSRGFSSQFRAHNGNKMTWTPRNKTVSNNDLYQSTQIAGFPSSMNIINEQFPGLNTFERNILVGKYSPANDKMIKASLNNYTKFPKKRTLGDGDSRTVSNWQRISAGKNYVVVPEDAGRLKAAGEATLKVSGKKPIGTLKETARAKNTRARHDKYYAKLKEPVEASYKPPPPLGFVSIVGKSALINRSKSTSEFGGPSLSHQSNLPTATPSMYMCN